MKKIIFFTAGNVPTSAEIAELQTLEDETSFAVFVRNGNDAAALKYGNTLESCDLVAGTVPTLYDDVPVYSPAGELPDGTAPVANDAAVSIRNSAGALAQSGKAVVTGNTLTGVNLPATATILANAGAVPLQNSAGTAKGNGTAAVANGVVTSVRTPATSAIVANAEALTVPVTGTYETTATLTVAGGVVTGIALS